MLKKQPDQFAFFQKQTPIFYYAKIQTLPHAFITPLVVVCLQVCEQKTFIDEPAVRRWATSPEAASRSVPSVYSHQGADGQYVAVAAGNFKKTPNGIDLENEIPLPKGFYVFPRAFVTYVPSLYRGQSNLPFRFARVC